MRGVRSSVVSVDELATGSWRAWPGESARSSAWMMGSASELEGTTLDDPVEGGAMPMDESGPVVDSDTPSMGKRQIGHQRFCSVSHASISVCTATIRSVNRQSTDQICDDLPRDRDDRMATA